MNESHYVSLEMALKLKEAGIDFPESEVVYCNWYTGLNGDYELKYRHSTSDKFFKLFPKDKNSIPAPSLMEVMDRLLKGYGAGWNRDSKGGWCGEPYIEMDFSFADTPPNSAAQMLIKLEKEGK